MKKLRKIDATFFVANKKINAFMADLDACEPYKAYVDLMPIKISTRAPINKTYFMGIIEGITALQGMQIISYQYR